MHFLFFSHARPHLNSPMRLHIKHCFFLLSEPLWFKHFQNKVLKKFRGLLYFFKGWMAQFYSNSASHHIKINRSYRRLHINVDFGSLHKQMYLSGIVDLFCIKPTQLFYAIKVSLFYQVAVMEHQLSKTRLTNNPDWKYVTPPDIRRTLVFIFQVVKGKLL